MNNKTKKSQIEKYLTQLPKIEDNRSKNEVYQSIQRSLDNNTQTKTKRRKWIPLIASICSIFLVVLLLQQFHFTEESSSDDTVQTESKDNSVELFESNDVQTDWIEDEEIAQIRELEEFHYLLTDPLEPLSTMITVPLTTYQGQSILPIQITLEQELDPTKLITRIEQLVELNDNRLELAPIFSFIVKEDIDNQQVMVEIPETFEWIDSSTSRYLLENSFHYFYQDSDVKRIVFERGHPIAEEYEDGILPILNLEHNPVKLYKAGPSAYLLPALHQPVSSFSEALEEMKVAETEFYIHHTIPEDANIRVEERNNKHIYVNISSATIGHNQETVTMVEAIIATANLFNYSEITLDIGLAHLGKYMLDKPIPTNKLLNYIENDGVNTTNQR